MLPPFWGFQGLNWKLYHLVIKATSLTCAKKKIRSCQWLFGQHRSVCALIMPNAIFTDHCLLCSYPNKHTAIPQQGLSPNVLLQALVYGGRRQLCADLVLVAHRILHGKEKCLGNSSYCGPSNWNNTSFFTAVFISGFPHKTQTRSRTPKRPCAFAPPIMCWHGGQMYY